MAVTGRLDSQEIVRYPSEIDERKAFPITQVEWPTSRHLARAIRASYQERIASQTACAIAAMQNCVEVEPQRLGGIPVIRGTRFSLAQLFAELAEGDSISVIAEDYELDESQLKELLHGFALFMNQSSFV